MQKIESTVVLSFIEIGEMYPDNYILVKIVELDHSAGTETGIVLATSKSREELVDYAKHAHNSKDTIILQGDNLIPMQRGLYWTNLDGDD